LTTRPISTGKPVAFSTMALPRGSTSSGASQRGSLPVLR
jgi:hypothetical protein